RRLAAAAGARAMLGAGASSGVASIDIACADRFVAYASLAAPPTPVHRSVAAPPTAISSTLRMVDRIAKDPPPRPPSLGPGIVFALLGRIGCPRVPAMRTGPPRIPWF